jgi:hypothetical protein
MTNKKTRKGKSKKPRGGGHRPLATTRKTLEGRTLGEQIRAAEHGDSDPEIERLAYLVTTVRQFEERILRVEYPPKQKQDYQLAAGFPDQVLPSEISILPTIVSGCDPTTFESVVVPVVSLCLRSLGAWLAKAHPNELHDLAKFLEARPIEPRKDISPDGKIFGPRPADPKLFAALKIALFGLTHKVPETPSQTGQGGKKLGASVKVTKVSNGAVSGEYGGPIDGLVPNLIEWPVNERNEWTERLSPGSDPAELQRLINKVFETKRRRGAQKKQDSGSYTGKI